MGTKLLPGAFDCYAAAEPDEPMFVLLARDLFAPGLVRRWAIGREQIGEDAAKVEEAFACAEAMERWREERRGASVRLPEGHLWGLIGYAGTITTEEVEKARGLEEVARADIAQLIKKDREYGSSWKRRGGVGAYMMLARKADRMEEQVKRFGWDVFAAALAEGGSEAFLDTLGDLRRYLLLVEAEIRAQAAAGHAGEQDSSAGSRS